MSIHYDIGCGKRPIQALPCGKSIGVDIVGNNNENVIERDLFRDTLLTIGLKADLVTAINFMEHVPRVHIGERATKFPFIQLMQDIHDVLNEGGYFFAMTPCYPYESAFDDPTHCNYVTKSTFTYFTKTLEWAPPGARMYGFLGHFRLIHQSIEPPFLFTLLQKTALQ